MGQGLFRATYLPSQPSTTTTGETEAQQLRGMRCAGWEERPQRSPVQGVREVHDHMDKEEDAVDLAQRYGHFEVQSKQQATGALDDATAVESKQ